MISVVREYLCEQPGVFATHERQNRKSSHPRKQKSQNEAFSSKFSHFFGFGRLWGKWLGRMLTEDPRLWICMKFCTVWCKIIVFTRTEAVLKNLGAFAPVFVKKGPKMAHGALDKKSISQKWLIFGKFRYPQVTPLGFLARNLIFIPGICGIPLSHVTRSK